MTSTLIGVERIRKIGVERIRNIANWSDYQNESNFDNLSMEQVIALYDKCDMFGVDTIEEIEEVIMEQNKQPE
jgi:hypothetical protein